MLTSITRRLIHYRTLNTWLNPLIKKNTCLNRCIKTFSSIPTEATAVASTKKSNLPSDARKKKKKKWQPNIFRNPNIATRKVLNIAFPGSVVDVEESLLGESTNRRRFLDDSLLYMSTSMKVVEQNYNCIDFSQIIDFTGLMADIGLSDLTIDDVFRDRNSQAAVTLAVLEHCGSLSDVSFIHALLLLYRLNSKIPDIDVLESQCLQRLETMSLNNILLIADWWLVSGHKSQRYHQQMLDVVRNSMDQLTTDHILQLCYFVSMYQDVPTSFFNDILKQMHRHVETLSWSGIVNLCTAIIKCNRKVENNDRLLYRIGDRASKNIQDISTHDLTIILRSFSRLYFFHQEFLAASVVHLSEKLKDMSMETIAHNVFALSRFRVLNQPFMNAVANIVTNETEMNLRVKSVWMLLRAFARLNYEPPDADKFFEKCVDLMHHRQHQCEQFPFQFLRALISLAYLNRYYDSLLEILFEPAFLELCIKRAPPGVEKHLHFLSSCIEIDKPEYTGHKLPKDYLTLHHGESLQEQSFIQEFKMRGNEVSEMLQRLAGGPEYVKLHCLLNQAGYFSTVADIEMHLDENGRPVAVNDDPLSKPITKLAVLIVSRSHFLQDLDTPHGAQAMKLRHLAKLGYTVIKISSKEWGDMLSNTDKKQYLISKLSLSVDPE